MESVRIWRSPYIHFYEDEVVEAAEVYTDVFLRGVAEAGFNAIWIRGLLREIVPSSYFEEFGRNSATMIESLRTVIRRGQKAGVKVFIYMQPPMGFPEKDPFWKKHPDLKGATYEMFGKRDSALCTSVPEVPKFLRESACTLSKRLPGLGGLILITASEHVAHCYSRCRCRPETVLVENGVRIHPVGCPRCARREPREVVGEIVGNIRDGLAAAGNGAELWAWNWSWTTYEDDPQEQV
ncbi:hypothetical protein HQ520_06435, partial [bacterium]|nr:hypothetical protein [bacterium]